MFRQMLLMAAETGRLFDIQVCCQLATTPEKMVTSPFSPTFKTVEILTLFRLFDDMRQGWGMAYGSDIGRSLE